MNAEAFDAAAIDRVRRLGGDALLARLLDAFLAQTATRMTEARAAVSDGELQLVATAAHSLRSSAGIVGATELLEVATRLEQEARDGRAIDLLAIELEGAYARARDHFAALKPAPADG